MAEPTKPAEKTAPALPAVGDTVLYHAKGHDAPVKARVVAVNPAEAVLKLRPEGGESGPLIAHVRPGTGPDQWSPLPKA